MLTTWHTKSQRSVCKYYLITTCIERFEVPYYWDWILKVELTDRPGYAWVILTFPSEAKVGLVGVSDDLVYLQLLGHPLKDGWLAKLCLTNEQKHKQQQKLDLELWSISSNLFMMVKDYNLHSIFFRVDWDTLFSDFTDAIINCSNVFEYFLCLASFLLLSTIMPSLKLKKLNDLKYVYYIGADFDYGKSTYRAEKCTETNVKLFFFPFEKQRTVMNFLSMVNN